MPDTVKRQKGWAVWQKEQKSGKKSQPLGDTQEPVPTPASRLPFDRWRGFCRAVSYGWYDMFKKKNHHGWKDSRENGKVEKASATVCEELTLAQRSRGAPGGSNPVMLLGGKSSVGGLDGRAH